MLLSKNKKSPIKNRKTYEMMKQKNIIKRNEKIQENQGNLSRINISNSQLVKLQTRA
jgi:mevalonate kinase